MGLARLGRGAHARTIDQTPFGSFERDNGSVLPLWSGYRDAIKSGWRVYWWPTMALFGLRDQRALPAELEPLVAQLLAARALPVPLREIAEAVARAGAERPDLIARDAAVDETVGVARLEVRPTAESVERTAAMYRTAAVAILETLRPHGALPRRALEIGSSSGGMAFALAAAGVEHVLATDLEPERYFRKLERAALLERLKGAGTAELAAADAMRLDLPAASFDLVYSVSTLEHIHDPAEALSETARVLRPGGLAYHGVDPWFSPQGGHSLCTLDIPWGHARLTPAEFARYVTALRPHEAETATAFYREEFQQPRRSLAELRAAVADAGLEVLAWQTVAAYPEHRRWLRRHLEEVRELHPSVERADLLASGLTMILRRR